MACEGVFPTEATLKLVFYRDLNLGGASPLGLSVPNQPCGRMANAYMMTIAISITYLNNNRLLHLALRYLPTTLPTYLRYLT